jgi:hypothetical protein
MSLKINFFAFTSGLVLIILGAVRDKQGEVLHLDISGTKWKNTIKEGGIQP